MRKEALVDGGYRYWLSRDWGSIAYGDYVLWVMLNPSTADAENDDPTIRKCIGFTKRLGFSRLAVVNLYAYRATDPDDLKRAWQAGTDIVGPRNDEFTKQLAPQASVIICAWGAFTGVDLAPRVWELKNNLLPTWRACRRCHGTMSIPTEGGGRACPACLEHQGNEPACSALGFTLAGAPRHPLMMPYYAATELKPWPARSAQYDTRTPRPEGLTATHAAQLRTSTHPEPVSSDGDGGVA